MNLYEFEIKGTCQVDGRPLEVSEVIIAPSKIKAIDRVLTATIRENGQSGFWISEPKVAKRKII